MTITDPATKSVGELIKRAERAEATHRELYPREAERNYWEVRVVTPAPRSHHKVGDIVIWDLE